MKPVPRRTRKPSVQPLKKPFKRPLVNSAMGHYDRIDRHQKSTHSDKKSAKSGRTKDKDKDKEDPRPAFVNYLKALKNEDLKLNQRKEGDIHINLHLSIKDAISRQKAISRTEDRQTPAESKESHRVKSSSQQSNYQDNYFDDIQFFRELGRGAHAVVKSAVDYKRNRKIAVKFYPKKGISSNQLNNINNEIEILKDISNENIAALYDVVHTSTDICLIMEYGGGNSLYQYLKSSPECCFQEDEAKAMFRQVVKCVSYIHSKDIVHRDIKPENILLNKYKKLKLIDFGFAIRSGPSHLVRTFCGTPTYMAPEVVSKREHVGILADRWSLGVLLYTMLQGTYPFKGPTQKQLFKKIIAGQYEYVRGISKQAETMISSLLVTDPGQRADPKTLLKMDWLCS